jgi:hypothetical protein
MLLLLLVPLGGCAGYQIGNRTLFPNDIQTVHVPVFQSSSFRRDLGERLTEAVCKEITKRTQYRVTGDPNADTVLLGRITTETKHLMMQTLTGDPRESDTSLVVEVSWLDRRGNTVRQCPPVLVPGEFATLTGSSQFVPEVGQSVATAQQKAIDRLAQNIVSMMEALW